MRTIFFLLIALCSIASAEPIFQDRFEVCMSDNLIIIGHSGSPYNSVYKDDLSAKNHVSSPATGAIFTISACEAAGNNLVAMVDNGRLRTDVYDISTWAIVAESLLGHSGVALSPNGSWLATGDSSNLRVFDTSDWSTVLTDGSGTNHIEMVFSPDSSQLAVYRSSGTVRIYEIVIYDTSDWSVITTLSPSGDRPGGLTYNNAGTLLAASHAWWYDDYTLIVYNTSDWSTAHTVNVGHGRRVHFSHDDALLAWGINFNSTTQHLRVYNTSDWSLVGSVPTERENVESVRFNDDSTLLAYGIDVAPYLKVLDTSTWTYISRSADEPPGTVHDIRFVGGVLPGANLMMGSFP